MSGLAIPARLLNEVICHLEKVLPEEGCGLLAGKDGRVERVFVVENSLHSPTRFEMDALAQVNAMMAMEKMGSELLAIYHSHPLGPDHPSEIDTRLFFYPESASLIASYEHQRWVFKAYCLQGSVWQPLELTID
ncbi:MAG: M67 family metallopeptidase [Chloroflexi bacterium]|nr:M67 family metallopeptidase [Chloroflexota bacterium]